MESQSLNSVLCGYIGACSSGRVYGSTYSEAIILLFVKIDLECGTRYLSFRSLDKDAVQHPRCPSSPREARSRPIHATTKGVPKDTLNGVEAAGLAKEIGKTNKAPIISPDNQVPPKAPAQRGSHKGKPAYRGRKRGGRKKPL
jgi:hypothetical protein